MRFALDPSQPSPLFRQLEDQIRYAISVGELVPGDPLPSIRDLEAQIGVNRNTIRRAYLDLEAEGLLVVRQGREVRVAARPPPGVAEDDGSHAGAAAELATAILHRAESEGLDGLHVAECFARMARDHDAAYPRWAFLECSGRQAAFFAGHAQQSLDRRVVPLDLHDLRADAGALPPSIRHVLTPHWHAGEARDLLEPRGVRVFGVRVRISDACERSLRMLAGRSITVVVRDAESAPGFADIVRRHVAGARVTVAFLGDVDGLAGALRDADAAVYTTPCLEAVRGAAPAGLVTHELEFEPEAADLGAVRDAVLPALAGTAAAG